MKSRSTAPQHTGPEKVAYILPQGLHSPTKARRSGRPVRNKRYDPSGFLLVGMYESLSKTFTSREAAAKWAEEHGFKVKVNPVLRQAAKTPKVPVSAILAVAAMLGNV